MLCMALLDSGCAENMERFKFSLRTGSMKFNLSVFNVVTVTSTLI